MKTIQVEIEDSMLTEVEREASALERALQQRETIAQERKHARGYEDRPQTDEEVGEWEGEQVWGEP